MVQLAVVREVLRGRSWRGGGAHPKKTIRYTEIGKLVLAFFVFFLFFKIFKLAIGFFGFFWFCLALVLAKSRNWKRFSFGFFFVFFGFLLALVLANSPNWKLIFLEFFGFFGI